MTDNLKEKVQGLFDLAIERFDSRPAGDSRTAYEETQKLLCEAMIKILPWKGEDESASQIRRFLEDELCPVFQSFMKTEGTPGEKHRINNAVASMYVAAQHLSYLICQGAPWWKTEAAIQAERDEYQRRYRRMG